jgi:hypothetical protein
VELELNGSDFTKTNKIEIHKENEERGLVLGDHDSAE